MSCLKDISHLGRAKAFLEKYFRTSRVRKKITGITQGTEGETYAAYYERFKTLLLRCPQHKIKEESILQYFYEGLTHKERQLLDAASGGAFMDKSPSEGLKMIHLLFWIWNGDPISYVVINVI